MTYARSKTHFVVELYLIEWKKITAKKKLILIIARHFRIKIKIMLAKFEEKWRQLVSARK